MRIFFLHKLYTIMLMLPCITLGETIDSAHTKKQESTPNSLALNDELQTTKQKLDYANLFTKPNIQWNDIASEKSGFFVGLGALGAVLSTSDYLTNTPQSIYKASYPFGVGLHTKFGYAHYSTPYIGFRIYGEYSRIFSTDSYVADGESSGQNPKTRQYTLDSYRAGINVIFDTNLGRNYAHSLGVIIDLSYLIGIDFASNWTQQANGVQNFGVNRFLSGNKFALGLGVAYVYDSKHRFELMFHRFTDIRQSQESFVSASNAPIIFSQILMMSIGYVYVF